jgi:hypothetical protein
VGASVLRRQKYYGQLRLMWLHKLHNPISALLVILSLHNIYLNLCNLRRGPGEDQAGLAQGIKAWGFVPQFL